MIKIKNLIETVFILTLLFSCSNKQTDETPMVKQETPAALQDDKLEIKSYRNSDDLIEELYQEIVEKTPALKKLEDDLDAIGPKTNDLEDKFNKYDIKSNSYYLSASYKATAIKDSLLKKKILSLIETSNNQYSTKITELNSLLKQISKNGSTINDHHLALKIVLTLPMIEKYQSNNKPDKNEFKNLIKQQKDLIEMTDSLTTNY